MFDFPVVFVDIETTGGSYRSSRIIEIALIRYENGQITDSFSSLINPRSRLPSYISSLTGISDLDLEDAPHFEEIADEVTQILDGAVFLAHNVQFDYTFVKRELEACGHTLNPSRLCSVRFSRNLYPQHKGHSLQKIIDRHGIKTTSRHRAYDDAIAVHDFLHLAYREHGAERFAEAIKMQLKKATLPPNLNEAYLSGIKDTPGVYVFEDENGKPIYIGKSITLRRRILSHFAGSTKLDKEMKISMHTHRLRTIETSTEIEALLLESQMVKEFLPLYNRQLRRISKQSVVYKSIDASGYPLLQYADQDISGLNDLSNVYGVFKTKSKSKSVIENVQKTFDLCPKLLGLEKSSGACFKYQLRKCRGACIGKEAPESYNQRFEIAMERIKLESWPFKHPVVLPLSSERGLIIHNWSVAGYVVEEPDSEPYIERIESSFDLDTYRILRSHLKTAQGLKLLPQPLSFST